MVIAAVGVALAIVAVITLLGLLRAKEGYEDETGFHPGTPSGSTRLETTIAVGYSEPGVMRAAKSKDAVDPLVKPGDAAAGTHPLVTTAVLHTN